MRNLDARSSTLDSTPEVFSYGTPIAPELRNYGYRYTIRLNPDYVFISGNFAGKSVGHFRTINDFKFAGIILKDYYEHGV